MFFDFEKLLKINIINPPDYHRAYLEQELYHLRQSSIIEDNNDVMITFRNDLHLNQQYHITVEPPVGYDGQGVFWFDPNHEMARVNFDNFETGTTTLLVSKRFNAHFLYILILYFISFKIMRHGGTFCHASAVYYRGKTIMFPAWRHVGKTNLLLAFLDAGGELIADDGIILMNDGRVIPFSKRMQLLYFNFMAYPHLLRNIDQKIKLIFKFVENARAGSYSFRESTIEQFQKMIRTRVANSTVTGKELPPKSYLCDVVIHLNKTLGNTDEQLKMGSINIESLSTKATEETLFELTHFLTAYHVFKLTQAKSVSILDKAYKQILGTFKKGFSRSTLFELSFNQQIDDKKAKQLVDDYLNEA